MECKNARRRRGKTLSYTKPNSKLDNMGLQIRDKYTSVRTYCTTRFSTIYEYDSYQFRLRKDQYFIIGMVMILSGLVGCYTNLTSIISSLSALNIVVFVISMLAIVAGRKSINRGFNKS